MAVRTAYAPVAATVLTAANLAKLAGGWIGYIEVTADQTPITTAVDLTSLTLSVTVGTGRRLKITTQLRAGSSVVGDTVRLSIMEGATTLTLTDVPQPVASAGAMIAASVVLAPSSGAHTYKLQMQRIAGTGNVTMFAGATYPAYLLVEDIGATP